MSTLSSYDNLSADARRKWAYFCPGARRGRKHNRFLSLADAERQSVEAFLGNALNGLKDKEKSEVINRDKAPTYGIAIAGLKVDGKCPPSTMQRQVKYLDYIFEADHGKFEADHDKLKQLILPDRGFKTLKTAYVTIMEFE